jgi:excisionase family DNA binding protein
MDEAATSQAEQVQRVSVREAAHLLGVSSSTVHRMVRRGALRAETVARPQGIATKILIRAGDSPARPEARAAVGQVVHGVGTPQGDVPHAPALMSLERAEAMAKYNAELVGPLVEQIDRLARRVEDLATENGRHLERIASLEVELQRARAQDVAPEPTPAAEVTPAPATRPWWRRAWRRV